MDNNLFGELTGVGDDVGVVEERQEVQEGFAAGLQRVEHVALAALLEVDAGEFELVVGSRDGLEAFHRLRHRIGRGQQQTQTGVLPGRHDRGADAAATHRTGRRR